MNEPTVIYLYIEELIEKQDWSKALKYAQQLDGNKIGHFVKYVITKQVITEMKEDKILEDYYKFEGRNK